MVSSILVLMTAEHRARTMTPLLIDRLNGCGRVFVAPSGDPHDPRVKEELETAEVILTGTGTGKLDERVLDAAPRLRAVVHVAGTIRPIVDETVYNRGIAVSSQAAANAQPVAEYCLAMILLTLKGVPAVAEAYAAARSAVDVDALLAGSGVFHRRIGIISASKVGRRVIELLRPFDVETVVYDPYLTEEAAASLGVVRLSLTELLQTSDLVSLHAPLLPDTLGMIGASELAQMRDGTVFINTARGALVDGGALLRELKSRRLCAVIDVTDPEVPDPSSEWWGCPGLTLTPHVAGSRGLELVRIGEEAVAEVQRFASGLPFCHGVTREKYAITA